MRELDATRASTRLARSNAEAVVERMLTEPRAQGTIAARTAVGLVGAIRRNALAALSLHAGLELEGRRALPGVGEVASQAASSMRTLATAVREYSVPPRFPLLRQAQLAQAAAANDVVSDETSLIVDSIDTMAELLEQEQARRTT